MERRGKIWLRVVALAAAAAVFAACSKGSSGKAGDTDPLVSQARTGTLTPFGSRDQTSNTATYTSGAEASVATYTARMTMPDGTLATPTLLSLTMVPTAITQTPNLAIVSPLMVFGAKGEDGAFVERTALKKTVKGEVIVDRFIEDRETVVLMILHYGTDAEERYMIVPDDVGFYIQEDGSRLISFETRDTDVAFAVAVAKDGAPTNGYAQYLVVPGDSRILTGSSDDLEDEASQVALTWEPAEGTRTGYLLKIAYAAFTSTGCEDGVAIAHEDITELREKFPKKYRDTYVAKDLEDNKTAYVQLCSTNSRVPPDASPGVNLTFALPSRAATTLVNAPAAASNLDPLDVTVSGEGVGEYQYAYLSGAAATSCDGATYSDWIDTSTHISDAVAEGDHRLCVIGRTDENNVQVEPSEVAWTADLTPPGAFTIDAVPTPTSDPTVAITWQASSGVASYSIKVATDAGCTSVLQTLTAITETTTTSTLPNGTYYVCVTARDTATNTTAASNSGQISFVVN